jgi:hypothetical protein
MANNYPGFGMPAVQGVLFETTPVARQFHEIPAPTQSGILVGAATGLVVACSGTQQPPSTPSTPAQYWS